MFKLFIWDLDNTLIASSPLLWGAFSWVAEKYRKQENDSLRNSQSLWPT